MAKVCVLLAEGFETVEALAVVDVLRRAGVEVKVASAMETLDVVSAQKVTVNCDCSFENVDYSDTDLLFLPGGMPGTTNLEKNEAIMAIVKKFAKDGKYIAAICAAPSILGHMGLLQGKKAIAFPSYEKELTGAVVTRERVVVDGNIITSRGMGTAIDLGLKLVEILCDAQKADKIAHGTCYIED